MPEPLPEPAFRPPVRPGAPAAPAGAVRSAGDAELAGDVEGVRLALVTGDITRFAADAIVNAANESLLGGGGVDGAIHRAGGPTILEECRRLGGCRPGEAKPTSAGRLPARYVIHTVGPRYDADPTGAPAVLARAYRASLALAEEHGCRSIAFPSISTGAFGYPVARAAEVALEAVVAYLRSPRPTRSLRSVTFVLFDAATHAAYASALTRLLPRSETHLSGAD